MDELKACPFCGSRNTTFDYYEISCPQELGTIVVCNDCGASAKSIVDWNTRPIEDALRLRIAELSQAVGLITTLKPTMVMDTEHPLDMAKEVAEYVTARIAELEWQELTARIAELEAENAALKAELKGARNE